MRVLVIGASGLIGQALIREFSKKHIVAGADVEPLDARTVRVDMTDNAGVKKTLDDFKPGIILLPAAYPDVDGCEKDPAGTARVNVSGPETLSLLAADSGAKFVFFSSDYIFDGKNGPYDETASANPISEYGRQKLTVEEFISKNLADYLIIRTTVVYGPERREKNFALSLIKKLRGQQAVNVPSDQFSTPTYSPDLAGATAKLVESDAGGVFNVSGPELISRIKFAERICDIFNLDKKLLVPVKTEELKQAAKRPLNAGLKIDKLLSTVRVRMLDTGEGLSDLKRTLN